MASMRYYYLDLDICSGDPFDQSEDYKIKEEVLNLDDFMQLIE